jgi:cobalt-zinc-cadmium efflux system protein
MGKCGHHHRGGSNLKLALLLNLVFVVLEIVGGIWTNSIAILSDALHDGADCFSLGLAWYLQKLSARRADAKFTYGYRRFSSLGALITGTVLVAGLSVIVWNAFQRLLQPEEVKVPGMLAIAVVGILLNGAAAWTLRGGRSLNEKVAGWHLVEDTLGWVAVLLGSAVMMVWDLPLIDPMLALLISCFILWNVGRNLKTVALVFLQSAPPGFDAEAFDRKLAEIPGVIGSHHTHTWTLDGESHVFSTHLVLASDSDRGTIAAAKQRVHDLLRDHAFTHSTVEVELEGELCSVEAARGTAAVPCHSERSSE